MSNICPKGWVPVNLIDKVFEICIKDLKFNPTYTKNLLMSLSGDRELLSGTDVIGWNSLKKIYIYIYI